MPSSSVSKYPRLRAAIISQAVWRYHLFRLSLRDVELLLAERGIVISYETVRRWCNKFGRTFANRLRCHRSQPGDKWHMVFRRLLKGLRCVQRVIVTAKLRSYGVARRHHLLPNVERRQSRWQSR
jgi:putative transposase